MKYFENMSDEAKVWIYTAGRALLDIEVKQLNDALQAFAIRWESHGKNLNSAAAVQYDRFLVFMVDKGGQGKACGRAIDNSIRFIQQLEKEFGIEFLNRMLLPFEENGRVQICHKDDLNDKLASGLIRDDTIVFNTMVKTKYEYLHDFKIPYAKSWFSLVLS